MMEKVNDEGFHNCYSSPNIARLMQSMDRIIKETMSD
jgi:hypothetical protein